MRMWMTDPKKMCNQHLFGEHVELHMFVGHLKLNRRVDGYVENNLFEPKAMTKRHDDLVNEIKRRGYNHQSPLGRPKLFHLPDDHRESTVNVGLARKELVRRCEECRRLHK